MKIARANTELNSNRWRFYRVAAEALTDIVTILDICARQGATKDLTRSPRRARSRPGCCEMSARSPAY